MEFLTFGIMAPGTAQITSLEKDRCADTGTVNERASFYIKDCSFHNVLISVHGFLVTVREKRSKNILRDLHIQVSEGYF